MRLYTFRCLNCRHVFDIQMALSSYITYKDDDSYKFNCPKCKETTRATRVINLVSVTYKGDGFYSTDNKVKDEHSRPS